VKRIFIWLIVIVIGLGVYQFLKKDSTGTALEEIERSRGTISELLEEKEVRNGEVVFYIRQDGSREPVLSADYVKKTFLGWKWTSGGGHSLPLASRTDTSPKTDTVWSYQYIAATKGTLWSDSPFPLLFGTFNNPQVTKVTVKSIQTGQETEAKIIPSKGIVKLWYVFIPQDQGSSYELTGLSNTGEMLSKKRIN
jgi:hypothetical protein